MVFHGIAVPGFPYLQFIGRPPLLPHAPGRTALLSVSSAGNLCIGASDCYLCTFLPGSAAHLKTHRIERTLPTSGTAVPPVPFPAGTHAADRKAAARFPPLGAAAGLPC